jgi:hypothetical protein
MIVMVFMGGASAQINVDAYLFTTGCRENEQHLES